jgi:hypothetical protein
VRSGNGTSNANVIRLRPESANQNQRDAAVSWAVVIAEAAHAGDRPAVVLPPPNQAVDSTERGYLQALAPDPMLWPLTAMM